MRDVVVVIGMGRSGTSLTCQALERMGVDFGEKKDLIGADEKNELGYYEQTRIQALNNSILYDVFQVTWLFQGLLPLGWEKWTAVQPYAEALGKILDSELRRTKERKKFLGIKDPRITRLRPLWDDLFEARGVRPIYVLCWRHPGAVYGSLHPRDGVTVNPRPKEHFRSPAGEQNFYMEDVFAIWAEYMAAGIEAAPATVIRFEDWFVSPQANLGKLAFATGLDESRISAEDVVLESLWHVR